MKRAALIAIALAVVCAIAPVAQAATDSSAGTLSGASPASRSAHSTLQGWIDTAILPDLRWPRFTDVSTYVRDFYATNDDALVWLRGNDPTPAALAIIKELQNAEAKGLPAGDYDGDRWPGRLVRLKQSRPSPTAADRSGFDLALTVCLMRYLAALHLGRVNPDAAPFAITLGNRQYDLPQLVREKFVPAKPEDFPDLVAQLEPPFDGYRRLEKAVPLYAALGAKDSGAALPKPAKAIAPGDPYPGLPRLVEFLLATGDLPQAIAVPPTYQGPVIDAVKRFQQRHGLDSDGRLGRATVAAMNLPLSWRAEQLRLTLERWRWAPRSSAQSSIVVNLPEFALRAHGPDHQTQLAMRVVVGGSVGHRTPLFSAQLRYLIFRPYWNVPMSIQRKELVPKIRDDHEYLADNDYEVVTHDGGVVTDGTIDDDTLAQLGAGRLEIRQTPGPDNSLGLVKFVFPNTYDVYMHDTPSVKLFDKARRDFSHGCIRLQDPVALAVWALSSNPGWDRDRVLAIMHGATDNVRVGLAQPIAVRIVYGTAIAPPDGTVHFLNDIYGYDAELEAQLAKGYPYH